MFLLTQALYFVLLGIGARSEGRDYLGAGPGMADATPSGFLRFPSNAALGERLQPREALEGLRWFTGDWLRYDEIDGQLVVSDLRMGIGTGHYSFRFLVGERDPASGQWRAVTPQYWQGGPAARDMAALQTTLTRVWKTATPLPLAMWERRMTQK